MSGNRVLVGINNSIDSKVACLLLKKQGYDVYPLVVITADANVSTIAPGVPSSKCANLDLKDLQDFCQKNSLQLLAVDSKERFNDEVVDNFLSKRLMGMTSQACFRCYTLKMQLMYDKMLKLKFDYIATGHYAKIYLNKEINQFQVYRGIDSQTDQSHLLSHFPQEILSRLLLPLSEVQRSNILKIAQTLGINAKEIVDKKSGDCFDSIRDINEFVTAKVAPDLVLSGEVVNFDTGKVIREHSGLQNFFIGDEVAPAVSAIVDVDKNLAVYKINPNNKTVYARNRAQISYTEFVLHEITLHQSYLRETPQEVFIRFGGISELIPGISVLKNNNRLVVKLSRNHSAITLGERVVVYNKDGGLSKVLISGTVVEVGPFSTIDRIGQYRDEGDEVKPDDGEIFGF
jgi:tRNA-uridine 2-sulfurtransferase